MDTMLNNIQGHGLDAAHLGVATKCTKACGVDELGLALQTPSMITCCSLGAMQCSDDMPRELQLRLHRCKDLCKAKSWPNICCMCFW